MRHALFDSGNPGPQRGRAFCGPRHSFLRLVKRFEYAIKLDTQLLLSCTLRQQPVQQRTNTYPPARLGRPNRYEPVFVDRRICLSERFASLSQTVSARVVILVTPLRGVCDLVHPAAHFERSVSPREPRILYRGVDKLFVVLFERFVQFLFLSRLERSIETTPNVYIGVPPQEVAVRGVQGNSGRDPLP